MRRLALAFALLFLITNCKQTPTTNTNLLHLIPQKSAAILRIPDWEVFNETLKINEPSAVLNETGFYNTLLEYADLLRKFAPKDDAYLAFVALGDNDFDLALITKNHPKLLQTDSVFTKNITSYEYEETTVNTMRKPCGNKIPFEKWYAEAMRKHLFCEHLFFQQKRV